MGRDGRNDRTRPSGVAALRSDRAVKDVSGRRHGFRVGMASRVDAIGCPMQVSPVFEWTGRGKM